MAKLFANSVDPDQTPQLHPAAYATSWGVWSRSVMFANGLQTNMN